MYPQVGLRQLISSVSRLFVEFHVHIPGGAGY